MLHSLKTLDGFTISATDGQLGNVRDIYFDDQQWVIRYFEVDTGWLAGRNVLISPISVLGIDWKRKTINVDLTQQQVNNSPGIDMARPVSRQHETALSSYYGYPLYWAGPYAWGYTALPTMLEPLPFEEGSGQRQLRLEPEVDSSDDDPHLRTKDEIVGYDIQATDDTVGHVDDFLFDDQDWAILLMVVDTRNWWPGKHVLLSPRLVIDMSWEEKAVLVNISRSEIESSAEYDENYPPERSTVEDVYHRFSSQAPMPVTAQDTMHSDERR
jgi:uncharacterized protein YrrD